MFYSRTVVLVLALCSLASSNLPALTEEKVAEIKGELAELIRGSSTAQGPQFLTFIPGFVRLAFHDCVGKCDGCVNLQNQDNAGLEMFVFPLQRLYEKKGYGDVLSLADFWALAGVVAVEMGAEKAGQKLSLPYSWGRTDCPTAPTTSVIRTLPSPSFVHNDVLYFFQQEFGLSARETTALMGAHTLGRATPANSGYCGGWVRGEDHLDNEYYKDLQNPNLKWNQRNKARPGTTPKWQWERSNANSNGEFMMLNTDMQFARKIKVDSKGQSTQCKKASACPVQQSTAYIVNEYASDNDLWLKEFTAVFIKLISHVNGPLQIPQPEEDPQGQRPSRRDEVSPWGGERHTDVINVP